MAKRERSKAPGPSLGESIEVTLRGIEAPLSTAAMRVIVSAERGEEVSAERMASVAGAERENFVRTRQPPRLCSAIRADGTAPPRRRWALGDWRLARRIETSDAEPGWHASAGIYLCNRVLEQDLDDPRLAELAHEMAARSIGPLGSFHPNSAEQWQELKQRLAQLPTGPGISTHTVEQAAAETALQGAELTPFALYFGLEAPAGVHSGKRARGIRLALGGEAEAVAFDQLVLAQVGGDVARARTILAYIEAFGRQMDELGAPPSIGQYAERWNVDIETAMRERNAFAKAFPEEEDPSGILNLLWQGIAPGLGPFTRLLGVKVVRASSFPSVIGYFAASMADLLRDDPIGSRVFKAAIEFGESPPDPRAEISRYFALCARAVEVWCADALQAMGDEAALLGLRSLEPVHDEHSAAYNEQMLGEYRLANRDKAGKGVLLATQKALRVAASLRRAQPPRSTQPYLDGIRWAAKALIAAHRELGVEIVAEAKRTTARLDAVEP